MGADGGQIVRAAAVEGEWVFAFDDPLVTQLRVDYTFSLLLRDGTHIWIGQPFELVGTDGSAVWVPPGDVVHEVGAALPLFNMSVREAKALSTGELRIGFVEGPQITVPVNEHYESWGVTLPAGEMLIGTPGGGISRVPPLG
jgi:hypothetical protein